MAILHGIRLGISIQVSHVTLKTDSSQLASLFMSCNSSPDWSSSPLVDHIRELAVDIPFLSWGWTSRLANQVADHIAWLTHRRKCPVDWVHQPPSTFVHILLFDAGPAPT